MSHRLRASERMLAALLLSGLVLLGVTVPANADLKAGLAWLAGTATADGSYTSAATAATPFQATSEALRSFRAFGIAPPQVPAAHQFLDAEPFLNTEHLARRLVAAAQAGDPSAELLERLATHQGLDGGFGDLPEYESSILDTAWALDAQAAAGAHRSAAAAAAVGHLLERQRPDGGWDLAPSSAAQEASLVATATALGALAPYRYVYSIDPALQSAAGFLLAQRGADGLWGESFASALALDALVASLDDLTAASGSLAELRARQQADGSWEQDVYATALALRALERADAPPFNPGLAAITGLVVDGRTGVPLAGVKIDLSGPSPKTLITGVDGRFAFLDLVAGDYGLTAALSGYATVTGGTTAHPGHSIDFGTLQLLPQGQATTATVRGVIHDTASGDPLPGASVILSGAETAATLTDAEGRYQFVHVPTGSLQIQASHPGYSTATGMANATAGGILVFSAGLTPVPEPLTALRGTVTDAVSGHPLTGARITLSGANLGSATTDALGHYEIRGLATGATTLVASLLGYDSVAATATVFENSVLVFSPALFPESTSPPDSNRSGVTGAVVDASTGEALAGVAIRASFGTDTFEFGTGADGRFLLEGVQAEIGTLAFSRGGYQPQELGVTLLPLSVLDIGQVRLQPEAVYALLPDLVVAALDTAEAVTDPQTLQLTGRLHAAIRNQGDAAAAGPIEVLAFYDGDRSGTYEPGIDTLLGGATATGLAAGEEQPLDISVEGPLPYRDAPVSLWVDSGRSVIESIEQNNLGVSSSACRLAPRTGIVEPVLKWEWGASPVLPDYRQVIGVPLVAPLEDSNADGRIDTQDVPSVILNTFAVASPVSTPGVLRALRGSDGGELWSASDEGLRSEGFATPALGDLDGDGFVEIVVPRYGGGLLVLEHTGALEWSRDLPVGTAGWGGAALADLEGDGRVEIVLGDTVLDPDGNLLWQGGGYRGFNNQGPLSIVADLDLDGVREIVAGASAYRSDGSLWWQNTEIGDGFSAVGDLLGDEHPEIAVVATGRVSLLSHDGALLWGPHPLPGGGSGGPPSIADTDGDGRPEIGVAGAASYSVFNHDGTLLWSAPTAGEGAGTAGASVFDFDGDGAAELAYADTANLYVWHGDDGTPVYTLPNSSGSALEYPVIADLDADGHADLLLAANALDPAHGGWVEPSYFGLRVFEGMDNSWVPTRPIWNQHAYHIDHIEDDGSIPEYEPPSWLTHNSYRRNAFADRDALASPDLSLALLRVTEQRTGGLRLSARIGNAGAVAAAATAVAFFEGDPEAGGQLLGRVAVPMLGPDRYLDVFLEDVVLAGGQPVFALADPDGEIAECEEVNNRLQIPAPDLQPDLVGIVLDRSALTTDLATGQVEGLLQLVVGNRGVADSTAAFALRAFYDHDGDGLFDPAVDAELGAARLDQPLVIGASAPLALPVAGVLPFRDAPIQVLIDSEQEIAEGDEGNNLIGSDGLCRAATHERLYTLNADFEEGSAINVVTSVPDQLQLDDVTRVFPFIWVPASGRGTVLKIDTLSGQILGEYLSAPSGRGRNPSRTTVDKAGSVWAGNRDEASGGRGSVVQIGLQENGQCIDRNANGVIDTSSGRGDIRPWSNAGGADTNGGVSTAEDECILKYVRVAGDHVRHVSVDPDNNVWTAGNFGADNAFDLLDNKTGEILSSFDVGCGGYGGLVDKNGVIWSANRGPNAGKILRYDTKRTLTRADDTYSCLNLENSYGVGIDSRGYIWNSRYSHNWVFVLSPSGSRVRQGSTYGANYDRGVTVTPDDNVWVANSGGRDVSRLANNTKLVKVVQVGYTPTGLAVDASGKVWATNYGSHTASRINPATNQVDLTVSLGSGAYPYTYGDMTGSVLQGAPPEGTWTVLYDSGVADTPWGTLEWTADVPGDGLLAVRAASSADGLVFSAEQTAEPGVDLSVPDARYLRVSGRFVRAAGGESPVLYDLTVRSAPKGTADLTASRLAVIDHGAGQPLDLSARIGNAGAVSSEIETRVAFYQGDPEAGGVLLGTVEIGPLAAGAYLDVVLQGVSGLSGGEAIHVVADADQHIAECDELNNRAQTPVPDSTRGDIEVATDAPAYGADTDVWLQARIANQGAVGGTFTARVQIEDAAGELVAQFPVRELGRLDGGHSLGLTEHWNTARHLAGSYVLRGVLWGADGGVQDQDLAYFLIRHPEDQGPEAALRTSTDRAVYHSYDTVEIENLARNLSANVLIEPAVLRVAVTDPGGQVIYTDDFALGALVPGAQRSVISPLALKAAPLGVYRVQGWLLGFDDARVLASDEAEFLVENDLALSLLGEVEAQRDEVLVGETQVCTDRVTNGSYLLLDDVPIRRRLTRLDLEQELGMTQLTLRLTAGETRTLLRDIPTTGFEEGDYACVLQAYLGSERKWVTLDYDAFRVKAPPIRIDAVLGHGERGRVLVLLDDELRHCAGFRGLGLESDFPSPLPPESTVRVELLDPAGVLLDAETAALDSAGIDGDGIDLAILDFSPTQLALAIHANGPLGDGYRVLATLGDGTVLDSGMVPSDCSTALAVGDPWGSFRLTEVERIPAANDPLGPNHLPELTTQRRYLEALLTRAGWSYTIVTHAEDFTAELRSGGYLAYLLLSEHVKLDEPMQKELREAVYRAEGLLEAGSHDQRQGRIDEVLGIDFRGKHSAMSRLSLLDSEVHPAATAELGLDDRTLRALPGGAEPIGVFDDGTQTAVTIHPYGEGRSLYGGLDLLAEATLVYDDTSLFARLLLDGLGWVHPPLLPGRPGGVYPLRITLSNLGIATPGRVQLHLPDGVTLVDPEDGEAEPPQWTWRFALAEDETLELTAWLRLPTGSHLIEVVVESGAAPDWVEQARLSLSIQIEEAPTVSELLLEAEALGNAYRHIAKYLGWARDALDAGEPEEALGHLVRAADECIRLGTEAAAALRLGIAGSLHAVGQRLQP